MRVLIADKQAVIRNALKILLQTRLAFDVVGEVADKPELLAQAETVCPDLVLLDENLVGKELNEAIADLHRLDCKPVVIILGLEQTEQAALAAGADAFASKSVPPKNLLVTIERFRLRNSNV